MRFGTSNADLSGPSAGALRGILPASELRAVVTRERNRSERSRLAFSLVIFTVGDEPAGKSPATLATILRERLRSTDEVGWLDSTRIAAVLPYTPAEEAAGVVRSIEVELARLGLTLPSRIETYPAVALERPAPRSNRNDGPPPASPGGGNGSVVARPKERSDHAAREGVAALGPTLAELVVQPLPLWKRAMDVAGASIALLLLWPLFLIAAIAIKLDSRGPIFSGSRASAPAAASSVSTNCGRCRSAPTSSSRGCASTTSSRVRSSRCARIPGSRASDASCAARASTSCRSSGTS
jgi:hypothetical protein